MSNINVRVVGTANVTGMTSQFAKVEAQVTALNSQLAKMVALQNGVDPSGYERMARAAAQNSRTFRNAAASTGMFEVQQLKVNRATDDYVTKLKKQKMSFRELLSQQKVARAAYKEQLAMQNMVVRQNASSVSHGKQMLDVSYPKEVSSQMNTAGHRLAWFNEQLKSGSTQMVNWGKNTQWAGRQLMVGFTLPLAAAGAAAGVMAYQIDKAMTQVAKVYDTTADQNSSNVAEQVRAQRELDDVRKEGLKTAMFAAKSYGSSAKDTIDVMGELAATGKRGQELQASTAEVMRISMLGDLDYQDSIKSTVALQSVFKMSTAQLTESFNYMNAVENATSLTTQDFAQAIPIAAAPVKAFGGNIQELGVLLTAMKSRGIEATQGANAIKAAMQRLGRPSKQIQQEWQAITGTDITKIFKDSDSLIDLFQKISDATADLGNKDKIKAFAGLFGSYQVTRMMGLVEGMKDLDDATTQTGKAYQLAGQGAAKWADIADREVAQKMKSVSGQWQAALATMQLQLAAFGQPFVIIATKIVKAVSWIMAEFNKMPKGVKIAFALAAGFAALAGPLVMLTGLFANLMGNTLKFGTSLTGLFVKMEILDKESRAAKLAADLASAGFTTEASAVEKLTIELTALAAAQAAANRQAGISNLNSSISASRAGGASYVQAYGMANQGWQNNKLPGGAGDKVDDLNTKTKRFEGMSDRSKTAWKGIGGGVLVAAGGMAMMSGQSDGLVHDFGQMALYAGLIAPALMAVPWRSLGAGMKGLAAKGGAGGVGLLGGLKNGGVAAAKMVATFARFAGPAGLLVAAVAGVKILHDHIDDTAESMAKLNDNGEKWAKIMGYQARTPGTLVDPVTGEETKAIMTQVEELQKSAPEVGDAISKAFNVVGDSADQARGKTEAMNIAIRQGLNVIQSGGSADQARKAVETSLMAGIQDAGQVKELMKRVDLEIDFKVNESVLRENLDQVMAQVNNAVDDSIAKNRSEKIWDFFSGGDGISEGSRQAGKNAAKDFSDAFIMASDKEKIAMSNAVDQNFKDLQKQAVSTLTSNKDAMSILSNYGVTKDSTPNEIAQTMFNMESGMDDKGRDDAQRIKDMGIDFETINNVLSSIGARQKEFSNDVGRNIGFSKDVAGNFGITEDILKRIIPGYMNLKEAENAYGEAVKARNAELISHGKSMTTQERLQLLNVFRVQNGLEKTGNVLDGFGPITKKWTAALGGAKAAADGVKGSIYGIGNSLANLNNKQILGIRQGGMEAVQNQMADDMRSAFDTRMQSALDARQAYWDSRSTALDNEMSRASDALDAKWERRKDKSKAYWDRRSEAVENAIKVEEKAESLRQKMFENEIARINKLNEAQNTNIDFNMALNQGKFDEAAKIRNDAMAANAQTALEAASGAGAAGSEKRVDRLNKRKDAIDKAADRAAKRLEKQEAAEKAHLERVSAARKAALQRDSAADMKATQAEWDRNKKLQEDKLALFLAYTARNEKDLKAHMARTGIDYDNFGKTVLKPKSKTWGQYFGDALHQQVRLATLKLASDNMWANLGQNAAEGILRGMGFSSMDQFVHFVETGEMKKDPKRNNTKPQMEGQGFAHVTGKPKIRHKGGFIGAGQDSRKGVPKTFKGLHSSEALVLAQKKEFMVNADAASASGGLLNAINAGQLNDSKANIGKGVGGGGYTGLAGMMAGTMAALYMRGIQTAMGNAAKRPAASGVAGGTFTGQAGNYGGLALDAAQMRNAATIASVGSKMGMSVRDIEIGIMTSIAESSLKNLNGGDRDSAGLFQQRPSQGWGSFAQVTNPTYAATKFFNALKGVTGRAGMSPWLAAQSVQRSAFSDGSNYQKWWDEAQAIFGKGLKKKNGGYSPVAGAIPSNLGGSGGMHKASVPGKGWSNSHDYRNGLNSPLYAYNDGTVVDSRAITSGGSPGNGLYSTPYRSFGETIAIRGKDGNVVRMAHLSPGKRYVRVGDRVRGGQLVGLSGQTGNATGPHTHFEVNGAEIAKGWFASHGIGLKTGGYTASDGLANLHKNEVVVDPVRTKKLFDGIDRFDSGASNSYTFNMDISEPGASAEDIANVVIKKIERKEARKATSRKGK